MKWFTSHIFLDKGTRFWPLSKYTSSKLLHNSALHAEARKTVYLSYMLTAHIDDSKGNLPIGYERLMPTLLDYMAATSPTCYDTSFGDLILLGRSTLHLDQESTPW
jgi:hypothetical protein